jgi:hypothetical protein
MFITPPAKVDVELLKNRALFCPLTLYNSREGENSSVPDDFLF